MLYYLDVLSFINIVINLAIPEQQMKTKSVSCSSLIKQIQKDYASSKKQTQSKNNQFIPFCSERRLGKLIQNKSEITQSISGRKPTRQQLIQKINFRNFDKIYQTVIQFQNKRYSELTRKPQQRNLINKEWKMNSLSKLSQKNRGHPIISKIKTHIQDQNVKKQGNNFQKMDKYLFKKMSLVREPKNNPELQDIYNNYIKICELNENIKRIQLRGQTKLKTP